MSDIHQRKLDHIALCHTADVHGTDHHGLWEEVALVHDALPELATHALDLRTPLLDHTLRAPLMVTGMTGGPAEAGRINRGVAQACGALGLAFGVGSQRVITRDGASATTFRVRDVAPDLVLFGNLGINQVRDLGLDVVRDLVARIEANYLAVHLNPAQELAQPGDEADHDFRHGYETLARLVDALDGRVLVKECGTGLSPRVVARLHAAGVRAVDLSGSGGTSWVKVESLRATGAQQRLGQLFAGWGIPTAAAVLGASALTPRPQLVASGGIGDGLAAAKALALGADVAGMARPVLQAFLDAGPEGGPEAAQAFLEEVIAGLRMAMVLTGCHHPAELRQVPRVIGPRLQSWEHTWQQTREESHP